MILKSRDFTSLPLFGFRGNHLADNVISSLRTITESTFMHDAELQ